MGKTRETQRRGQKRSLRAPKGRGAGPSAQAVHKALALPMEQQEIDAIVQGIASGKEADPSQAMAKLFGMALQELSGQLRGKLQDLSHGGDPASLVPGAKPVLDTILPYVPDGVTTALSGMAAQIADKIDDFSEQIAGAMMQTTSSTASAPNVPAAPVSLDENKLMELYQRALQARPQAINPRRFAYKPSIMEPGTVSLHFGEKQEHNDDTRQGAKSNGVEAPSLLSATTAAIEAIGTKSLGAKALEQSTVMEAQPVEPAQALQVLDVQPVEDAAHALQAAVEDIAQLVQVVVGEIAQGAMAQVGAGQEEGAEVACGIVSAGPLDGAQTDPELDDFLASLGQAAGDMDSSEAGNEELAQAFGLLLAKSQLS